jgi:ectoine hydroxylase-related dioxygenase (phytanoyl-CoA dioxygenase family)
VGLHRLPCDASVGDVVASVREHGYALVEHFLAADAVAAKRAAMERLLDGSPTGRNSFEGFRTQRIYSLFAKSRAFDDLALHPLVLGVVDEVLGPAQFSVPSAIQIGPGEDAQALHHDDSVYPLPRPHPPLVLNTMWPLCEFTSANGATRVVPGSHRWGPERQPRQDEAVDAEMAAGSVLFYDGALFHGGGANRTGAPRLGVILEYAASWLRPQETQLLAVPPEVVVTLPPRLQELLGYNLYPEFLGHVDGRHPRRVLERGAAVTSTDR